MATYFCRIIGTNIHYKVNEWPNSGDPSFTNLNQVVAAIGTGHTLVVGAGVYDGTLVSPTDALNFNIDNFIFRSAIPSDNLYSETGGPVIIGPETDANYPVVRIVNRTNLSILGDISIKGGNTQYGALQLGNGCDGIHIEINSIYGYNAASNNRAMYLYYSTIQPKNILIKNTKFYLGYNVADTIYIVNVIGDNIVFDGCTVDKLPELTTCGGNGVTLSGSNGIVFKNGIIGSDERPFNNCTYINNSSQNKFIKNDIVGAFNGLVYPNGEGRGFNLAGSSDDNDFISNKIFRCNRGARISTTSGAVGNRFISNFLKDCQVNGLDNVSSSTAFQSFIGNTIIHRPLGIAGHGIVSQQTGRNTIIKNNIVISYTNLVRPHNIQCIAVADVATTNAYTIDADNNRYIALGTAYTAAVDLINQDTIDDYKNNISTNSGFINNKEINSSDDDPAIDIETGILSYNSNCINAGQWLHGINDIGNPDPWGYYLYRLPNIGAYQGPGPSAVKISFVNTGGSVI